MRVAAEVKRFAPAAQQTAVPRAANSPVYAMPRADLHVVPPPPS
jgi:hypothetical protein